MKRLILKIYAFFEHRTSLLRALLLLVIVGFIIAIAHIHFVEDISTFIPQNEQNSRANYAFQHMGAANKLVVSISSKDVTAHDPYMLSSVADSLAEQLQIIDTSSRIKSLFYRIDESAMFNVMQFVVRNMPYYLDTVDYLRMEYLLQPQAIDSALQASRQILESPIGGMAKQLVAIDPLMFSAPILEQLNGLQRPENYQVIDGYLFTKDSSEALLIIESTFPVSETSQNAILLKDIDKAISHVTTAFNQEVNIDCIGAAVISVENATRIKKDTIISTLIALIGILLILFYFFRDWRALLILLFSISFGGLFALAFLAIFKGSVSIIAIGIGSIMVGIAANYPIHYLAHYQQGYSKEQTLKDITTPLITGNITTVGAFLSLVFISSDAMKDLGLFAALLLIGAILFVVIVLPHLFNRSLFRGNRSVENLRFGRIANFQLESHRWIVLVVLLLTIPLYMFSRRPAFESDMSTINYMTTEQRAQMQHMISSVETRNPVLFCAAEGTTMEQALQAFEESKPVMDGLLHSGLIHKISGIDMFIPSQALQQQRLIQWNDFWNSHRQSFADNLQTAALHQGFRPDAFDDFITWINTSFETVDVTYFQPLTETIVSNWLSIGKDKNLVISQLELNPDYVEQVEASLNGRSPSVYTFSNNSLLTQMIESLSDDFDWVLYVCGLIVLIFLTCSFGRLELSLITFLPLAIGWVWILGLMGIFNLKFNIVNIILATFIFGMGDDYAIFVTEGMMYEYTYRKRMLASYKNSVFLSASIMLVGIGALIVAKHPAMRSLAEVTIVGMCTVVLMAYLFPPLLYRWLTEKKGQLRRYPITLWNLFKTILSMTIFILFATMLTLVGFVMAGTKSKRGKYRFHCWICSIMRFCIRILPQVKSRIINPMNETFQKPSIIISNHQSQLDLLYVIALNPKIICLTNQWVWNCPFYKYIIRFADYYPIMDNLEDSEPLLRQAINDGYSIMIFPEGTRSEDCSIGRFHKGAFYMAQRLGVDILPIMLHGVGHMFPKHEFMLRKGSVTIQVMPRVSLSTDVSYSQYAHQFRQYYKDQYRTLANQCETPDYMADRVIHSYLYKGKSIEQYVRKSLRQHNNYTTEIDKLPNTGTITITDTSYGAYPLLAALVKKDLLITAHLPNADQYAVACNLVALPPNLIILP